MKKKIVKIILTIIIILILGSIYPIYISLTKNKDEKKVYFYEIKNNSITLLANEKIVNFYNCEFECEVFNNYFNQGKILLKENNKIYLYNLLTGSKLSNSYDELYFIYDEDKTIENIKYFIVKNNGLYGIIDLNGKNTVNINYLQLTNNINNNIENSYSLSKDLITAKSNDLWGIISISSGKGVIDFQYEEIMLNDNYILIKDNSLWYLISEDNRKINNESYDNIYLDKNLLLVEKNKECFILSREGKIISDKIKLKENDIIDFKENTMIIKNKNKETKYYYDVNTSKFTTKK